MSSAHGAGLMVAPVLLGAGAPRRRATTTRSRQVALGALSIVPKRRSRSLLHVGAMLAVMGVVALLVYEKLGVASCARRGSTPTRSGPPRSSSPEW